jgi:hypothetical protein
MERGGWDGEDGKVRKREVQRQSKGRNRGMEGERDMIRWDQGQEKDPVPYTCTLHLHPVPHTPYCVCASPLQKSSVALHMSEPSSHILILQNRGITWPSVLPSDASSSFSLCFWMRSADSPVW